MRDVGNEKKNAGDPGPMGRFEGLLLDRPRFSAEVFARLSDEEDLELGVLTLDRKLRRLAKLWGLPRGEFVRWYTTQYAADWEALKKLDALSRAMQALEIADAGEGSDRARQIRVDVRKWLASKFDRGAFGDALRLEREVVVTIDEALIGSAARLLEKIAGGRVVAEITQGEAHGGADGPPSRQGVSARLPATGAASADMGAI